MSKKIDLSEQLAENNATIYDVVQLLDTTQDMAEKLYEAGSLYENNQTDANASMVTLEVLHIRKKLLSLVNVSGNLLDNACQLNDQLIADCINIENNN